MTKSKNTDVTKTASAGPKKPDPKTAAPKKPFLDDDDDDDTLDMDDMDLDLGKGFDDFEEDDDDDDF